MSGSGNVAILEGSVDHCPLCDEPIAILLTDRASELNIRLTAEDEGWLARGRHPAYAYRLKPMIEAMAKRAFRLELRAEGDGIVSSWFLSGSSRGPRWAHVPLGLALLMFESAGLPFWADEALMDGVPADHFEDIQDAFAGFLSDVSPEDFESFDAHH